MTTNCCYFPWEFKYSPPILRPTLIITGTNSATQSVLSPQSTRCLYLDPDTLEPLANFSGAFYSSGVTFDGYFHSGGVQFFDRDGTQVFSANALVTVPDSVASYRQVKQSEVYKLAEDRFILATNGARDGNGQTFKFAYDIDAQAFSLVGNSYRHGLTQDPTISNYDASCAETLPIEHDTIVGGQRISHQFQVGRDQQPLWPMEAWRESGDDGGSLLWKIPPTVTLQPWPVDIMPTRRADGLNGAPIYCVCCQATGDPPPEFYPAFRIFQLTEGGQSLFASYSIRQPPFVVPADGTYPSGSNKFRPGIVSERCPIVPGDFYVSTVETKEFTHSSLPSKFFNLFKMSYTSFGALTWRFPGTPHFAIARRGLAIDPLSGSVWTTHRVSATDNRVTVVNLNRTTGAIVATVIPSTLDPNMTCVNELVMGSLA